MMMMMMTLGFEFVVGPDSHSVKKVHSVCEAESGLDWTFNWIWVWMQNIEYPLNLKYCRCQIFMLLGIVHWTSSFCWRK